MPGSHLFNLGLFQKRFLSTSKLTGGAINMGSTRGRGSASRMYNYCIQRSPNPSLCINQFINVTNNQPTYNIVPFLCYVEGRRPGNGIINTNFGWDSKGVWFFGDAGNDDPSYPISTNFSIPSNKPVEVSVDFVYNDICSDFGLCFYKDSIIPEWAWYSNITRIACQYNCEIPEIAGLTESVTSEYDLINPNTYTCHVIYNPNSNPNIIMNTKFDGAIVDTITINNQTLNGDYRIGFCADQTDTGFKTYMKNLKININNGEKIYENNLQSVTILPC